MEELNDYEQICLDSLKECLDKNKDFKNKFIVDIGCSSNSWFINLPFIGLLIDADLRKISTYGSSFFYKFLCKKVTPYNVCDILKDNNTPKEFYCLNLDTDGYDLFTLIALLKKYTPQLIITEINEKLPPPVKFSIKYDNSYEWEWNHMYGYSIACLTDVMTMYNYSIFSLNYNNIILIKNKENEKPNIDKIEEIYINGYLKNKKIPVPSWNDDVKHLRYCKTKEEVAAKWRKYFEDKPNPNTGEPQIRNLDKYVINDEYETYLKEFIKTI
jgi:hypothetical protein